jgi:hypothetical protein
LADRAKRVGGGNLGRGLELLGVNDPAFTKLLGQVNSNQGLLGDLENRSGRRIDQTMRIDEAIGGAQSTSTLARGWGATKRWGGRRYDETIGVAVSRGADWYQRSSAGIANAVDQGVDVDTVTAKGADAIGYANKHRLDYSGSAQLEGDEMEATFFRSVFGRDNTSRQFRKDTVLSGLIRHDKGRTTIALADKHKYIGLGGVGRSGSKEYLSRDVRSDLERIGSDYSRGKDIGGELEGWGGFLAGLEEDKSWGGHTGWFGGGRTTEGAMNLAMSQNLTPAQRAGAIKYMDLSGSERSTWLAGESDSARGARELRGMFSQNEVFNQAFQDEGWDIEGATFLDENRRSYGERVSGLLPKDTGLGKFDSSLRSAIRSQVGEDEGAFNILADYAQSKLAGKVDESQVRAVNNLLSGSSISGKSDASAFREQGDKFFENIVAIRARDAWDATLASSRDIFQENLRGMDTASDEGKMLLRLKEEVGKAKPSKVDVIEAYQDAVRSIIEDDKVDDKEGRAYRGSGLVTFSRSLVGKTEKEQAAAIGAIDEEGIARMAEGASTSGAKDPGTTLAAFSEATLSLATVVLQIVEANNQ